MAKNKAFDHSKYALWIDPKEVTPYEGNAKKHDKKQVANLVTSITRFGWQQDTVLTKDKVVVIGHGRRLAALEIGCEMPYHMIDKLADDLTEKDIRELRIADNQTNAETGLDFDILGAEIADLDFEGFDFDFGKAWEKHEDADKYTHATKIPQYEPKAEAPAVDALIDDGKVNALLAEIEQSGLGENEKRFLRLAAYRHAVIDFDSVADYYAQADPEMQRLMEHSALVIIDIDDAIANGFTTLTESIEEIMEEDIDG